MRFSTVLPFAAAVLALDIQNPARRKGCEGANCANVPAPKIIRGVMSVRDDRCQYSCHLQRLRDAAIQRQGTPKAKDVPLVPDAQESAAEAKQYDEDFGDAHTLDLSESGSAIAALLAGRANKMLRGRADAPPPAAPLAAVGQYDVAVTSIPRRSEGLCKFAIDVLPNAEDATPAISCRAGGTEMIRQMNRATAGLLAARLAQEYDANCALTEKTTYHVSGDPGASYAVFQRDDNTKSRNTVLGETREVFFLDCGAVFINQPVTGFSGSGTAAQIKMVRDSRGLLPLMAEWFPADVFASQKPGDFSADAPPPWLKEAESGI
ncbi:hypothetical protein MY11210_006777 [Beauveria gryllotalpidicola]